MKNVLLAVTCLLSLTLVLVFFLLRKAKEFILNASKRLAGLKQLNSTYRFDMNIRPEYNYNVSLPNKRSFDSFDPFSYLGALFSADEQHYNLLIHNLKINSSLFKRYDNDLSCLPPLLSKDDCRVVAYIPFKIINRLERKIIEEEKLKPVTDAMAVFSVKYTSPKGRNHYSKQCSLSFFKFAQYYNTALATKNMKKFQRSLMTDSLRYDVMKRDGFRCVLCGRTASDGVKLHVDHIVPIAKGGITEINNLRTLCEFCNMGKKDKYDPNGIN